MKSGGFEGLSNDTGCQIPCLRMFYQMSLDANLYTGGNNVNALTEKLGNQTQILIKKIPANRGMVPSKTQAIEMCAQKREAFPCERNPRCSRSMPTTLSRRSQSSEVWWDCSWDSRSGGYST